jgi:predicted transcriptional regulator
MEKMSLSFKVDPRLKKALENLAVKENRSLSNYVITLLMKHLEDQDVDWRRKESEEFKQ